MQEKKISVNEMKKTLFQLNDTYMNWNVCYNTRIKKKEYTFPELEIFKEMSNEKIKRGVPICEAYLPFIQIYPKEKNETIVLNKGMSYFKLLLLSIINIGLIIFSDFYMYFYIFNSPILYAIVMIGMLAFNVFMYGKIGFISALKLFALFSDLGFFSFIIFSIPWNIIPFVYGIIMSSIINKKVSKFIYTNIREKTAQNSQLQPIQIYQELYPYPLMDWKKIINDENKIIKLKLEK